MILATGLTELEAMVSKGVSLNEQTITRLDASVQHYWQKAQATKQFAIRLERRVRALKEASKGNE